MKKILLMLILLIIFVGAYCNTPLQAQEEDAKNEKKETQGAVSVQIINAKTIKPCVIFKDGDAAEITCAYTLPEIENEETANFSLKWEIFGPNKKESEGENQISVSELTGSMPLIRYGIDKKSDIGIYTVKVSLLDGKKIIKTAKDTFTVADPSFYIGDIYTTGSLKGTEQKTEFKRGEAIVFVIDQIINFEVKGGVKEVQFFVYDPNDEIVLGLTTRKRFKAAKGHYVSKYEKMLALDLEPGTYSFMGKIVVGGKETKAKVQFEVK